MADPLNSDDSRPQGGSLSGDVLTPLEREDNAHHAQILDEAYALKEAGISPELISLLEKGLHGSKLPAPMRSKKAAHAFHQAFEMIGGVTRLAIWGDRNLTEFYRLYGRLIQAQDLATPQADPKSNVEEFHWVPNQRLSYKQNAAISQDILDTPVKGSDGG